MPGLNRRRLLRYDFPLSSLCYFLPGYMGELSLDSGLEKIQRRAATCSLVLLAFAAPQRAATQAAKAPLH